VDFHENKARKYPDRSELQDSGIRRKTSYSNPYNRLVIYSETDPLYGEVEFFEHIPVFDFPKHDNDSMHVVRQDQEHNLPLISYELYGSPLWWWVLFVAQDPPLEDPVRDIVAGKLLRVPALTELQATYLA
jgi:hypothetical protein